MSIKLIFFDIDDTLCRIGKLTANNLAALQAIQKQGIKIAIATGRSPNMLPSEIQLLFKQQLFDGLVSTNGQINFCHNKLLSDYALSTDEAVYFVDLAKNYGFEYQLISRNHIAFSHRIPRYDEFSAWFPAFTIDPDFHHHEVIYQVSLLMPIETDTQAIETQLMKKGFRLARWQRNGADIVPLAGSKSRGIRDFCQHLGIEQNETMAFGDGLNDIEMLQYVGIGVAMGDGWPELLVVADYVTGSIEEDGISSALKHFSII